VESLDVLGTLVEPVRRAAYRFVAAAPAPVGRDDVAAALGIGRTLAAFHLDKLAEAGLLDVSYARRTGRSGPGAGRPAKLYQRAEGEHSVSVPPRRYLSAATLLAEAVERTGADPTLFDIARREGAARSWTPILECLADQGYQPEVENGRVVLRNCPFHALAQDFTALTCGLNLALLEGIVEGRGYQARLDPGEGRCCVVLSKTKND
jgi:predicted ArsR family transcriptional regulator